MVMRAMPTPCVLGLGIDTLTAWGDGQLNAPEMERIADHVPTCPACQSLLQDFALIKQRLTVDNGPDLRATIWRGVQAGMRRPAPRLALNQGALWRGAAALGAVIVVVVLFAQVLQLGARRHPPVSIVPTGTIPATPVISPTAETASTLHLPGWQNTGPAYAGTIVFAPTAPLTGYTCGKVGGGPTAALLTTHSVPQSSGPGPIPLTQGNIPFGITHDGGKTWATIMTGITGTACWVTVDPTNAQDVVVAYDSNCLVSCDFGPIVALARSTDGGQTWRTLAIPPDPAGAGKLTLMQPTWAGGTLILAAQNMGTLLQAYLLISVNGGPFTVTNDSVILRGLSSNYIAGGPFGVGNAIYVTAFKDDISGFGSYAAISIDNGATWRYQRLSHNNLPLVLDASSLAGKILIGTYFVPDGPAPAGVPQHLPMLESRDGGATWTQLPLPSTGEFFMHGIGMGITGILPDGTLFALCHITAPDSFGIYELAPGASAWRLVAPGLPQVLQAVSTDAAGHPIALWGHAGATLDNVFNQIYGLQYFPLGG